MDILRRLIESHEKRISAYIDLGALRSHEFNGVLERLRDLEEADEHSGPADGPGGEGSEAEA